MELLFASHNEGKTREIRTMLGNSWIVKNLHDLEIADPIDESGNTLEENALIKARYLYNRFNQPCFADDSGLEVEALKGEPGVYSARYAGRQKSDEDNMALLLANLSGENNRMARFRTVIAFIDPKGEPKFFEGTVKGKITYEKRGTHGFGYDPIFEPEGSSLTFAEMSVEAKNRLSHRAKATAALVSFLQKQA